MPTPRWSSEEVLAPWLWRRGLAPVVRKGIEITDSIFLVGEVDTVVLGIGILADREGRDVITVKKKKNRKQLVLVKYQADGIKNVQICVDDGGRGPSSK
jgi:hypothetical protein